MAKAKAKIREVTMPAGEYYIGDPCYAVPDNRWMEWLEAADYTEQDVLIAELDGHPILGIGTAHGDGQYHGSDSFTYGVDAGLIGAVPVKIGDYHDDKYPAGAIMTTVEFTEDFDCYSEDGVIHIGHIEIDTDKWDLDDDEEDWR